MQFNKGKVYYLIITMLIVNQASSYLYGDAAKKTLELSNIIKTPTVSLKIILNFIDQIKGKSDEYIKTMFATPLCGGNTHAELNYNKDGVGVEISEVLSESLFEDILMCAERSKEERLAIAKALWRVAPRVALNLEINEVPLSIDLFRKIDDESIFNGFCDFLIQEYPDALRKKTKDNKNIFHITADPQELILSAYPKRQSRIRWAIKKRAEKRAAPLINFLIKEKDNDGNTPLHLLFTEAGMKNFRSNHLDHLAKGFLDSGADVHSKNKKNISPLEQVSSLEEGARLLSIISQRPSVSQTPLVEEAEVNPEIESVPLVVDEPQTTVRTTVNHSHSKTLKKLQQSSPDEAKRPFTPLVIGGIALTIVVIGSLVARNRVEQKSSYDSEEKDKLKTLRSNKR